jgi:hypothetical protein
MMAIPIPIISGIFAVIDKLIPDPEAKAKAKLDVLKMEQAGEFKLIDADLQVMIAQADINKAEASSANSWASGWRPAVGWVCVTGLAWTYVLSPLLGWLSAAKGWPVPPTIDTFDLLIMLGGMLGFGGMRSFEKIRGKA